MNRSALALVVVALTAQSLPAQEPAPKAAWILFETGKTELEQKDEPGLAVYYFRQALAQQSIFPEVEVALGDIYLSEGELALAEEQYRKAYEFKGALYIPDEQYSILLKLADLYEQKNKYKLMQDTLLIILEDQPYHASPAFDHFRNAFQNTYFTNGIDQFLRLYRLENVSFAAEAHTLLAWLYYRSGRFEKSILQGLFSVNIAITTAVDELRRHDPDYEFTTLSALLPTAMKRDSIRELLFRSSFFPTLYYLASASYAYGQRREANAVWRLLSSSVYGGQFTDLSQRQLQNPWIESRLEE